MSINEIIILIIIGFLAGVFGGTFGVGGGIIIIPALIFILGLSQHQAQGTSLAVLLFPIGILAVLNYTKNGYVNYKFAAILIVSFVLGSYLGSEISVHLPEKILRKVFGIFILLVSLKLIFSK
jgi:uncharacterized membrane protein YfcA